MKVLLINPPIDHMVTSTVPDYVNAQLGSNPMPPLGLMYLASYVFKHTKHEVKICDMVVGDNLWQTLCNYKPDVVGITTTTLTLYDALETAKLCKRYSSSVVTVMGGAHCSIYPNETSNFKEVDFVVQGEGESPLFELLGGWFGGHDKILPIDIIDNLDDIPFPSRELIDIRKYHSAMSKNKLVTSMITSRGCPMNCSFCYQPHYGKRWRARSADNVVNEIEEIVKLGIYEIEIYDDTFTYDQERALDICLEICRRNLKVDWAIRTRVDCVNKNLLMSMALAGCKRINYGIESVTPSVLKMLRKGFNMIQVIDAIRDTTDAGIEVQAYFMLGSPRETREQILNTIRFANKYIPDYCYYSITSPCPSTLLYTLGLRENRFYDYWRGFAQNPRPDFHAYFWNDLPRDELIELMEYGFRSFYLRPSFILKQLFKVRSFGDFMQKAKTMVAMR
jgi:radical SAM superfamily enzyme YgiQ (UPF0313 family)